MLTLIFAIILLIAGYMVYGKIIEKILSSMTATKHRLIEAEMVLITFQCIR